MVSELGLNVIELLSLVMLAASALSKVVDEVLPAKISFVEVLESKIVVGTGRHKKRKQKINIFISWYHRFA